LLIREKPLVVTFNAWAISSTSKSLVHELEALLRCRPRQWPSFFKVTLAWQVIIVLLGLVNLAR
jgi:hypothetical protein